MDPQSYNDARVRPSLEERLESIISGAALMADSSCTRDDRRERIVQECTAVRQALQDLLSEYVNNVSANNVYYVSLVSHDGIRCFAAAGPKLWNRLPPGLRQADISFQQFKLLLKTFCLGDEIAPHCD